MSFEEYKKVKVEDLIFYLGRDEESVFCRDRWAPQDTEIEIIQSETTYEPECAMAIFQDLQKQLLDARKQIEELTKNKETVINKTVLFK